METTHIDLYSLLPPLICTPIPAADLPRHIEAWRRVHRRLHEYARCVCPVLLETLSPEGRNQYWDYAKLKVVSLESYVKENHFRGQAGYASGPVGQFSSYLEMIHQLRILWAQETLKILIARHNLAEEAKS